MTQVNKVDGLAAAKEWQEKEFLPWKAAMAKYRDERGQQMMLLKTHASELQTIVALLIDGRTKQALLAWNTLQLHPKLKDLRVGGDGESVTMVATDGTLSVMKLDDVLMDLQELLQA